MSYRFLIVDDHEIFRKGLKHILLEEFPSADISEASNAADAIKATFNGTFTIIISDLSMPARSGLDLVEHVKDNLPDTPVLILSMHPEEQYAIRALKTGAAGYLIKESASDELITAVKKILNGRKYISSAVAEKMADQLNRRHNMQLHEYLSDREFEVFKMIASGKSIGNIADTLSLSVTTISTYRSRILSKMDVQSNADLTRYAIENNLI
jgi:two-component system, NarL family, invasion response regulator UvrY